MLFRSLRIEDNAGWAAIQPISIDFQAINRPPCIYDVWPNEDGIHTRGEDLDLRVDFIDYDVPFGDSIASVEWDLDHDGQFDDFSGNGTVLWDDLKSILDVDSANTFEIQVKVVDSYGLYAIETTTLSLEGKAEPEPPPAEEPFIDGFSMISLIACIGGAFVIKMQNLSKKKRSP